MTNIAKTVLRGTYRILLILTVLAIAFFGPGVLAVQYSAWFFLLYLPHLGFFAYMAGLEK